MRSKLFISYSHKDAAWLKRIQEHLTVLDRAGVLETFADSGIGVGVNWLQHLTNEMQQAKVALLLVSASFLGSEFISRVEVPTLLQKQEGDGLILYPLLVKDCPWQLVPWLASRQIRPSGARPVSERRGANVDKILADVAREIASLLISAQAATVASTSSNQPSIQASPPLTGTVLYQFTGDDKRLQASRLDLARNIERIIVSEPDDAGASAVNALVIGQHNSAWSYHIDPSSVEKHLDEAEALHSYLLARATAAKPSKGTADIIFALGRMKDSMLHRIRTLRTK